MTDLPSYVVRRTPEPIIIDGVLNEPVWSRIEPVGQFRRVLGDGLPALATELKLCWDDRFLYFGWTAIDTNIWGTYRQHDDPVYNEEVVESFICSSGDLTRYFEFNWSPHNVIFDAKIQIPENGDRTYMKADVEWVCEGMQSAVTVFGKIDDPSVVDEKWIVESAIPFAQIGRKQRAPVDGEEWRANFYRIDREGEGEYSCWSPALCPSFHTPMRFGRLVFSTDMW